MATLLWPQVHAYLLTLWADSGLTVCDGPPLGDLGGDDLLIVGWSGEDVDAGELTQTRSPMGNTLLVESGTVVCLIDAQTGGTDLAAVRARAFEVAGALTDQLAADQSLGGLLVDGAVESAITVLVDQTDRGAAQRLLLSVTYTGLT